MDMKKFEKESLQGSELNPTSDHKVAESAPEKNLVSPPPKLASQTCAKIWATIDSEEHNCAPNSGTFLDSAFFSPETFLPDSYLLSSSEQKEANTDVPKAAPVVESNDESPQKSSHWIGLVASVSVGIVVAVFLFPMIEFVKRSTQFYVAESWETEIHRRVGQYEQIHTSQGNATNSDELPPYNLASSNWQELNVGIFALTNIIRYQWGVVDSNIHAQTLFGIAMNPDLLPCWFDTMEHNNSILSSGSGHLQEWDRLVSSDVTVMADSMLLSMPDNYISVRSAFGQNILLRDSRVFFRVLPIAETPKK